MNRSTSFQNKFDDIYSYFSEAEKALREINSSQNKSLNIRAEFAFDRRQSQPENDIVFIQPPAPEPEIENEAIQFRPPMAIDLNRPIDNVHEKITEFERSLTPSRYLTVKSLKMMTQLADASGGYDSDSVILPKLN